MSSNPLKDRAEAWFMMMMRQVPVDILPDFDKSEAWLKANMPQEHAHLQELLESAADYEHKQEHHREVN